MHTQAGAMICLAPVLRFLGIAFSQVAFLLPISCVDVSPPDDDNGSAYNNTTDPTNNGATYVGAKACGACHAGIAEDHLLHGHANKLTRIQGQPPAFPEAATGAGVPDPPQGFDWSQIAYVLGGYTRSANFIGLDGHLLTTGLEGVPTQWNLAFAANGTTEGFVDYEPTAEAPTPYAFSCFGCHTTGAQSLAEDLPERQDNRSGILGTWAEPGVQCEACHGPGSNHLPNTSARDLFVGATAAACGQCHMRGDDPDVIDAAGGFIDSYEQWPELLASGGHAGFSCTTCHNPHASTHYDREDGIRNGCTACHSGMNLAIHDGFVFRRGDYEEPLTCESCHMPFASRGATSATTDVVGEVGRMGDTRTHIFRINTAPSNYRAMFTGDGLAVVKDDQDRAAVTLDFVCFRCHNGIGNAAPISTLDFASGVATGMHEIVRP